MNPYRQGFLSLDALIALSLSQALIFSLIGSGAWIIQHSRWQRQLMAMHLTVRLITHRIRQDLQAFDQVGCRSLGQVIQLEPQGFSFKKARLIGYVYRQESGDLFLLNRPSRAFKVKPGDAVIMADCDQIWQSHAKQVESKKGSLIAMSTISQAPILFDTGTPVYGLEHHRYQVKTIPFETSPYPLAKALYFEQAGHAESMAYGVEAMTIHRSADGLMQGWLLKIRMKSQDSQIDQTWSITF